jgi:hypothetical protein
MPCRNSPPSPAELIACQARAHAEVIGEDWQRISWPGDEPPDYDDWAEVLTPFLIEHPMRRSTRDMISLHEAGHVIAFERLGMLAAGAHIEGSSRGEWSGTATAINRSYRRLRPPYWAPEEFRAEAVAAFAGPVAEELFGGGSALASIGELLGACLCAEFAAQLRDEDDERVAVDEALTCAISLVERYGPAIREAAALLSSRKHIWRGNRKVQKILAGVPQDPFDAGPLSPRGQALHDKIVAGINRMWVLGREVVATWELVEAGL